MQSTDTVVIVTPDDFKFNYQTSETNTFQNDVNLEQEKISEEALEESKNLEASLVARGVRVIRLPSKANSSTPDAVFPNNWFSIHTTSNGLVLVLYPMLNLNRRAERQVDVLTQRLNQHGIDIQETIDLTYFESESKALEGTGSIVLDRVNRIAYAARSPRMNSEALAVFCERMQYTPVEFSSYNEKGVLIYHTNVMMSVGTEFAVVCKESITDASEADRVVASLERTKKTIIYITLQQLYRMCGNILEVRSTSNEVRIAMSETAYETFTPEQREQLSQCGEIVHMDIRTIEAVGGGSVRCMLAEIFH